MWSIDCGAGRLGHDNEPPPAISRNLFERREPLSRVTIAQEDDGLGRKVWSEFTIAQGYFVNGCMTAIVVDGWQIAARLSKTSLRGKAGQPDRQSPPPDGQSDPDGSNCARHDKRTPTGPGESRVATNWILYQTI